MTDTYWSFRKIIAIEEPVFNSSLERFYNLGVEGLVRENIQNSLDGKLPESGLPVQVIIKTGVIGSDAIPGIHEICEHINCLKGENEYTCETIGHMKEGMNKAQVPFISFEDRNTKGLTGAERGENAGSGDTWGIYAYKKGVHFTDLDAEVEGIRGGSHGVGKIACNAASDLYLMFFSNCDEEGKCHIGGTVQLIEHSLGNSNYRSTGYFTKVIGDVYYPFENNFDPIFEKNTRGLKIIIPYLRKQFQDEKAIIRAVCDNFFVAILRKGLVVKVNEILINDTTILDLVRDESIYVEQDYADIKSNFTPLYIRAYMEQKPFSVTIRDKRTGYQFSLFLLYDERIKKGRVAIVRGIGMKIEDKKITSYVNAPFSAVLIPDSSNEDIFLKSLENESHTQLSSEHIKNPAVQANAKRFINNITRELQKIVAELLREAHPSDGAIDTSDVIYSIEHNFKKELSKEISTVQLTKGKKGNQKTVIAVKTKGRSNARKRTEEEEKKKKRLKNMIRKVLKKDGQDTEKKRVRYPMVPESVKRLVLKEKEILIFDFTNIDQYYGETVCDISISVIDGTGKSYESEFDIKASYSRILDRKNGNVCNVSRNIIKDVTINEGKVQLDLYITEQFNRSLKFMYYVEV